MIIVFYSDSMYNKNLETVGDYPHFAVLITNDIWEDVIQSQNEYRGFELELVVL